MRSPLFILVILFGLFHSSYAQAPVVRKCEPPNWWVGMTLNRIQLMVYGEHLHDVSATSASPSVRVTRTSVSANGPYAFVDIEIPPSAAPGDHPIVITSPRGAATLRFPVLPRTSRSDTHKGFDGSDVIYLITPDRFADGDTTNNTVEGMPDRLNRRDPSGRHGGDLQGIIDKLPYLSDLGVTALWLNPVVENNMARASYHGYGATDLYAIDARFGSNALYASLVAKAHEHGLNVIMDHVNNHIGIRHPWIQDLPSPTWLNGSVADHQKPFHSKPELDDIHSDSLTKQRAVNGWFEDRQADLNQTDPLVAQYLIQSTIWWIEYSGIDGIREDTYPYIDPTFRERWCATVMKEYPRFNIVGEVWIQDPVFLAPYQRGSRIPRKIQPELPALTDFGLYDALTKTFADSAGRIENVFTCLAKDFLFADPKDLVTFLDNHDVRRIMYMVNGDVPRFKLALLTLLTTRGIPQLLYGTELGMKGGPDHGTLRADFPGGFPHDERNAFTSEGRTPLEQECFTFTRNALHVRKEHAALQTGSLIHFKPSDEVYPYLRIAEKETLLVVINHNREARPLSLVLLRQYLTGVTRLRELLTGKEIPLSGLKEITLDGMTGGVYALQRGDR